MNVFTTITAVNIYCATYMYMHSQDTLPLKNVPFWFAIPLMRSDLYNFSAELLLKM